jgi:glucose/arabinose dehydrogenase/cytochrome c2
VTLPLLLAIVSAQLFAAASDAPIPESASVAKGEALFRQRCAVCHPTGARGGQAPGLANVLGRKAGTGTAFSYTPALANSGLIWDAATLDRYLANPVALVPGSKMVISVPDPRERRDLIAYLSTLRGGGAEEVPSNQPPSRFGDYRTDAPGLRHHITVADLPAPFATSSVHNAPSVVPRPVGAMPQLPPGFSVNVFSDGLQNPRLLRVAPNGDLFVAESAANRIRVLRSKAGGATSDVTQIFAEGLDRPFGIAFHPPGPEPRFVYVANVNSIVRFPYGNGDLKARGPKETIVAKLAGTTGGHWTRDLAFSRDGTQLFVSVGSESNVAEGLPPRSPDEIRAWEASHGMGSSWGDEEERADVLVMDPDGKHLHPFATGIRNCVGLTVQSSSGDLWCSTNERDGLGDDLVPDYVTRVRQGAFFGWPWFYLGPHPDPRHAGERSDLANRITVPDVLLASHSASLEMTFYEGTLFPADYLDSAFVALHGSWNRSARTGYKVIRVLLRDGVPTGEYEDFLTGFVVDAGHVWGRPVGVAVARDGALLVSEDANGTIWRVTPGTAVGHSAP